MGVGIKTLASNKKARHNYHINERIETGIVLTGTEVKSLRAGRCNIADSYARIIKDEIWIIGMHISPYENQGYVTHDPEARRKLLLHKSEIKKLLRKVMEKGLTLVPLKLYLKNSWVKVELGVASGKRQFDKRQDIAQRDQKREIKRLEKRFNIK